ncbi:heavy metal-associated domain protein [Roseburia inulinivorans DSM 16841]|uniref:Heavy metal-associated domain protein n=1 Tax=Roseburia inulinivorans DSM 16841 TaxID=622312 RepID=C0FSQ5_9FIRM|nr:heavy metal-associated domain protein [Roseburia inulinivorans DSM 16841]
MKNKKMEEWIMKKKFKLEDLDCANCAAKMEDAIKKIPGVNDASVSFMTQKMSIDAEDAKIRRDYERSRCCLCKG